MQNLHLQKSDYQKTFLLWMWFITTLKNISSVFVASRINIWTTNATGKNQYICIITPIATAILQKPIQKFLSTPSIKIGLIRDWWKGICNYGCFWTDQYIGCLCGWRCLPEKSSSGSDGSRWWCSCSDRAWTVCGSHAEKEWSKAITEFAGK